MAYICYYTADWQAETNAAPADFLLYHDDANSKKPIYSFGKSKEEKSFGVLYSSILYDIITLLV